MMLLQLGSQVLEEVAGAAVERHDHPRLFLLRMRRIEHDCSALLVELLDA